MIRIQQEIIRTAEDRYRWPALYTWFDDPSLVFRTGTTFVVPLGHHPHATRWRVWGTSAFRAVDGGRWPHEDTVALGARHIVRTTGS